VLKQIGELLYFRGKLNLHSEVRCRASGAVGLRTLSERNPPRVWWQRECGQLLETPDFYWSEALLEELYHMMSRTLDVNHRISILNKKLDYANELVGVLRDHLSEKHSLKLVRAGHSMTFNMPPC